MISKISTIGHVLNVLRNNGEIKTFNRLTKREATRLLETMKHDPRVVYASVDDPFDVEIATYEKSV